MIDTLKIGMEVRPEYRYRELVGYISRLSSGNVIAVLLSGGVDSSVLTAAAYDALGDKALAVTFNSPLTPRYMLRSAERVADYINIRHLIIDLNELELTEFKQNPINRCYICRKYRIRILRDKLARYNVKYVLDGTTYSEIREYRPGLRALNEEREYVKLPYVDLKIDKATVREIAKMLKLPSAEYPPDSCLATRVRYGYELTIELLNAIDSAEEFIRSIIGLKVIRVRVHNDLVRIEVSKDSIPSIVEYSDVIAERLHKLGFKFITLDIEGYRSGSFDL